MCRNDLPFNVLIISCKVQIPHLCKKGVDLHSSMFQGGDPGRDPTFSMIYQKTLNSPHARGDDPERDHVFSQQYIQQTLIIPHSYGGDPRDPTLYSPCTWGCGMHEFFPFLHACRRNRLRQSSLSEEGSEASFVRRSVKYHTSIYLYLLLFTLYPFYSFIHSHTVPILYGTIIHTYGATQPLISPRRWGWHTPQGDVPLLDQLRMENVFLTYVGVILRFSFSVASLLYIAVPLLLLCISITVIA